MDQYQDWRLVLRLLAPLGTPMQSDTLFGHLCWQVALAEGEEGIAAFLEPFRQGAPPLVLSDAFPIGLLPRPLLPRRLVQAERVEDCAARKRWDKAPFVAVDDFERLRRDPAADVQPQPDPWQTVTTPHAAIDRRIDTTGGEDQGSGRFYQTEARSLAGDPRVHVFLRCLPGWEHRTQELVGMVSRAGFGRDKSQGCGAFAVEEFGPWPGFARFPEANAFVSLSTLMPAAGDPTAGRWRLRIKRGFLGEHAVAGNPFKRPLVQLEPGAVFRSGPEGLKAYYGRLVPAVAPGMSAAVQCGHALAVPCSWRDPS